MNICSEKCFGRDGQDGCCCTLESRDFIIGPHKDAQEFVSRLSKKLGRSIWWDEVFISFEEGRRLFPDKPNWQLPESYPALRVQPNSPRRPCVFYNETLKQCTVYEIRPASCRSYVCDFLAQGGRK